MRIGPEDKKGAQLEVGEFSAFRSFEPHQYEEEQGQEKIGEKHGAEQKTASHSKDPEEDQHGRPGLTQVGQSTVEIGEEGGGGDQEAPQSEEPGQPEAFVEEIEDGVTYPGVVGVASEGVDVGGS